LHINWKPDSDLNRDGQNQNLQSSPIG
jgi:hypothetical protein